MLVDCRERTGHNNTSGLDTFTLASTSTLAYHLVTYYWIAFTIAKDSDLGSSS